MQTIDRSCPRCGSYDTQSADMIVERGSASGTHSTSGFIGTRFGWSSGSSSSQTKLAERYSGPNAQSCLGCAIVLLMLVVATVWLTPLPWTNWYFLVCLAVATAVFFVWSYLHHKRTDGLWVCLSCGSEWKPYETDGEAEEGP